MNNSIIKIHPELTVTSEKYISIFIAFIIKLGLLSHPILLYFFLELRMLLSLSMLLPYKICLIAQVFRLLHMLLETGCKLNIHKSYERSFYVLCTRRLLYESTK